MGFTKAQIKNIEKKAKEKCEKKAKAAQNLLAKKYTEIVDDFYKEYSPDYYVRHHDRGYSERGLDKPMEKVFKETSKGNLVQFSGGIILDHNRMYSGQDGYHGTTEQVLYSFLAGYHGLPIYQRQGTGLKSIDKNWYHGNSDDFITSNIHPAEELQRYFEKELPAKLNKRMDIDILDELR